MGHAYCQSTGNLTRPQYEEHTLPRMPASLVRSLVQICMRCRHAGAYHSAACNESKHLACIKGQAFGVPSKQMAVGSKVSVLISATRKLGSWVQIHLKSRSMSTSFLCVIVHTGTLRWSEPPSNVSCHITFRIFSIVLFYLQTNLRRLESASVLR